MSAREEIHRTFQLRPNASVKVEGIAGPVSIETSGGSTAEVHIVRMAATQRELDCYRTAVSGSPGSLTIEHVQHSSRQGCNSIRSRQQVRLRLPRSANVHLSTVAGAVDIGAIDGLVRLDSIAGRVSLAGVRSADISSLAGGLSLTLAPLSTRGVQVSSIVGPVNLSFPRAVNADVRLSSVMGSVRSESRAVDIREGEGSYSARIGSGGPNISLSSIVGPVRIRRD